MAVYVTGQDEILDQIAFDQYGDESMVMAILQANPGLASLSPVLPTGLRITLPRQQDKRPVPVVRLWGSS